MKRKITMMTLFLMLACSVVFGMNTQKVQAATHGTTFTKKDNSITLKWVDPRTNGELSSNYKLLGYNIRDTKTDQYIATNISPQKTSFTKTGLSKGYVRRWELSYTVESSYGGQYTWTYDYIDVNTTPKKLAKSAFTVTYASVSSKYVQFGVKKGTDMSGSQLQLYKGDKRIKTIKIPYTYSENITIKLDAKYKYRVRQYYTNDDTKKTYYGAWSVYRYFDVANSSGTYSSDVRGTKVTFKGVSGIKSYIVYVSKNRDNGYKKTTTVTVTPGRTKKVRISKMGSSSMKPRTTYYVKITPVIKTGSGTAKSDVSTVLSFYNYK